MPVDFYADQDDKVAEGQKLQTRRSNLLNHSVAFFLL